MLSEENQIRVSQYLLGTFIIIGVLVIAVHLFGGRTDVSDNGNGVNSTGKQLEQLSTDQQKLTGEIGDAAAAAGCVAGQAAAVRTELLQAGEQAADINGEIEESGRIIGESQAILETVRARGAARGGNKD